jgi:hypothetical protein
MKKKKIAFAAHTGNVMKSTLSQAMTIMCGNLGIKSSIACADVDMRSAYETLTDRFNISKEKNDHKKMYKVINADSVQNAIDSHTDEDLYIIDCPSPIKDSIVTLIDNVDCLVMPCPGSVKDIRAATKVIYSLGSKGIPTDKILIVMSRISSNNKSAQKEFKFACNYLNSIKVLSPDKLKFKIFPEYFRELKSYRDAINMGNAIFETTNLGINIETKDKIKKLIKTTMEY